MSAPLTEAQIREALQDCADEPVHIPGIIQPFGCLIATDVDSHAINYASENVDAFLGQSAQDLLGKSAQDILGPEAWHGVRNVLGRSTIATENLIAGVSDINGQHLALTVHRSGSSHVIEIEPAIDTGLEGPGALKTLAFLMAQIQNCGTEQELFDLTCGLLQHLSGYDRVLIYRFDVEFNGEVLAEAKQGPQDSLLGLRFPHWDIPSQARAIMAKLPLRFIVDANQIPVPILAPAGSPPLDITLAESRGVSPVHLEYLRNLGAAATMTLSVMVEGRLWGIISLHHRRSKVPGKDLRDILQSLLNVFSGKLLALRQKTALAQIENLDASFAIVPDGAQSHESLLPSVASPILSIFQAHGLATLGQQTIKVGDVPDDPVLDAIADLVVGHDGVVAIESLAKRFPEFSGKLDDSAGVLALAASPNQVICVFRNERAREVSWAGDTNKTIERRDGKLRLSPRGSFSVFLESVALHCEPWSEHDIYLMRHLRTLLLAAERQASMESLNRQQTLIIQELNHRVRNILALVRSVTRQARRHHGSVDSYADAIEARIQALAVASEIQTGQSDAPVRATDLILAELEPFQANAHEQATMDGSDLYLRPEAAPIFALVIHELVTNAAKYGALSVASGRLNVSLERDGENVALQWIETDGPGADKPSDHGFGMALIQHAIPHELGGEAKVAFRPEGLSARFLLPARHFTEPSVGASKPTPQPEDWDADEVQQTLPSGLRGGTVLVLDDNFVVAKEMADQMQELGCGTVRICASAAAALEVLNAEPVSLAVLDVHLGQGKTSFAIARDLKARGVPFLFVTGFNEDAGLVEDLEDQPLITKPITNAEFLKAINDLV